MSEQFLFSFGKAQLNRQALPPFVCGVVVTGYFTLG
jgi:hypothetical protein